MKLLIDIGHPAHLHLFRFIADNLNANNFDVIFTIRDKDKSILIAQELGLKYIVYGKTKKTIFGKAFSYILKFLNLFFILHRFKPTITVSHSSFYLSQASWLLRIPNITLEDTGNMEQILLYLPFTSAILTPDSYQKEHGYKQIRYAGYHELAYLHPSHYKKILNTSEIKYKTKQKPFVLIRLVNWTASHDLNSKGESKAWLNEIVNSFSDTCDFRISSEGEISGEYAPLLLPSGNAEMHQFLSTINIYIGEGATMASECAMMGIPAIYINSLTAGTIDEQIKYGLVYQLQNKNDIILKFKELIHDPHKTFIEHQEKVNNLLLSKINVTEFLTWFITEWPESFKIMKNNPDYQNRFK